jgi:hypothetical protein
MPHFDFFDGKLIIVKDFLFIIYYLLFFLEHILFSFVQILHSGLCSQIGKQPQLLLLC